MKKRKYIHLLIIILIIVLTFVIDYKCPFRLLLHIKCAGCGGRDMIIHLIHFEFYEAFMSNQLLFIGIPLFLLLLFIKYVLRIDIKFNKYIYALLMIIVVAFMVIRNLV